MQNSIFDIQFNNKYLQKLNILEDFMKYASVVILDNNQDLVNAITNEISSLVANIKILNVSQTLR